VPGFMNASVGAPRAMASPMRTAATIEIDTMHNFIAFTFLSSFLKWIDENPIWGI